MRGHVQGDNKETVRRRRRIRISRPRRARGRLFAETRRPHNSVRAGGADAERLPASGHPARELPAQNEPRRRRQMVTERRESPMDEFAHSHVQPGAEAVQVRRLRVRGLPVQGGRALAGHPLERARFPVPSVRVRERVGALRPPPPRQGAQHARRPRHRHARQEQPGARRGHQVPAAAQDQNRRHVAAGASAPAPCAGGPRAPHLTPRRPPGRRPQQALRLPVLPLRHRPPRPVHAPREHPPRREALRVLRLPKAV